MPVKKSDRVFFKHSHDERYYQNWKTGQGTAMIKWREARHKNCG